MPIHHAVTVPCGRNGRQETSLGTEPAISGHGGVRESESVLVTLVNTSLLSFIVSQHAGTSLLVSWTPINVFSSMGSCQHQCSTGDDSEKFPFCSLAELVFFNA